MNADADEMSRGRFARPVRRGGEVHRYPMAKNTIVPGLLNHLHMAGFRKAPQYLGIAEDGAERFTYISGSTGYPPLAPALRSDEALVNVARTIREFHDASQGFEVSPSYHWTGYDFSRPAHFDCIGHYDLAPWNIVFDGVEVVGIIDWDAAGPSSRVWDLAYAAHQFVPFHPTAELGDWGWPSEPQRAARLKLFLDAYGTEIDVMDIINSAVLRMYGIGAYLEQEIRAKNPLFQVQAEEGHALGYMNAAFSIHTMRESLASGR